MITEYLLKKILDSSIEIARRVLSESRSRLLTSRQELEDSIQHHLRAVVNWSSEVSFLELKRAKVTTDIFIDLDLFVYPRSIRIHPNEQIDVMPLRNIFSDLKSRHFVLLGQLGAGKTTSMKYLCQMLLTDETFYPERFSLPLLIRFGELHSATDLDHDSLLLDEIYSILGLNLELNKELRLNLEQSEDDKYKYLLKSIREKVVVNVLEGLRVLLILDGFDELPPGKRREAVIQDVRILATQLDNCTMILTSRTGEFIYNVENTVTYEISPLTPVQILEFAGKWLGDPDEADVFLNKVYNSPFADTAIRPLTLAHLCAIYERTHDIPEKPKTIYRKIVNLVLQEWDEQRSIKRYSRYANFEVDRKFDFLCRIAYELTMTFQTTGFSKDDLLKIYRTIYKDFDLAAHEARQVASELESHTSLFFQSGYEQYQFAHKSLQEYLAAEYIVRLPTIPGDSRLFKIPNELAIAITISSNSTQYFGELISTRFLMMKNRLKEEFIKSFFSRLLSEKPDLNPSMSLGLLLVLLYSAYLEQNAFVRTELNFACFDGVLDGVENLIKSLNPQSLETIGQFYRMDQVYSMDNGDDIHRMMLESAPHNSILLGGVIPPEVLYLRASFK